MELLYDDINDAINDIYKEASSYAIKGIKDNIGGPFGAGIIQKINDKYKIITISRNTVIGSKDPTCHAEVNAIRLACKKLNKMTLEDCILVTTAKSCPMCLSASIWAQIPTIYYSESYDDASESGFKDSAIEEYIKGNNKNLINEIQLNNIECKKSFYEWNNKEDKIQY